MEPNKQVHSKTEQTQQQLNQIFDILLDKNKTNHKEIKEALSSLFDLLLWAEKRSSSTLQMIFNSHLLILTIQQHIFLVNELVSGYILLLGNAMDDGLLINYLLKENLPEKILNLYLQYLKKSQNLQEEEHLHLLGSFLKAYYRHLTQPQLQYFIKNDSCLLIEICCGFFNCPEEITRTSIMNILMNILKLPFISNILHYPKITKLISKWCSNMCKLFRNQLKDFDQNLLITQEEESRYIIQSINDKIILWEDLSQLGNNTFFSKAFYEDIIIPLVVGSLNSNGIPLFTLKFALFILTKLTKTIANLGIINQLGELLFLPKEIIFKDNQLSTANLKPFTLKRLLQQYGIIENNEQQEQNRFKNVNLLFMNILRSKDGRFLQCICILLISLFTQVKKNPKYISYFIKQVGFGINGRIINQITEILINQFIAFHPLEVNKIITSLLLFIQPTKYFLDDMKNRFLYVYKNLIDQTIKEIQKSKDIKEKLAELFEYDAKIISSNLFNFQPEIKTDAALLFNNKIIQNQCLPFYQQLPETDQNVIRYNIVKCLLMRRISLRIIEQCSQDLSLQRYLQRIKLNDAKYIKPGQYLKLPIHCNSYRCKLLDNKIQIPNCLLIQDDTNFILGYVQEMRIKIIVNIKLKHVNAYPKNKKEKVYIQIGIKKFDFQGTHDLIETPAIVLKNIDVGIQFFKTKRSKVIERQISALFDILKKSRHIIPEISLI